MPKWTLHRVITVGWCFSHFNSDEIRGNRFVQLKSCRHTPKLEIVRRLRILTLQVAIPSVLPTGTLPSVDKGVEVNRKLGAPQSNVLLQTPDKEQGTKQGTKHSLDRDHKTERSQKKKESQ